MPSTTSIQARWWILTIPEQCFVPSLPQGAVYIKGQLEQGASGYRHWQLVCHMQKKVRLGTLKKLFGQEAHCEPTRSDAAEDYVWKEDTSVAGTKFELGQACTKRNSKQFWESQWQLAKSGNLEEIEADVKIKYYSTLKKIAFDHSVPPEPLDAVCGVWIWGPPGVGKSHSAREWYGKVFNKNLNKWWDGYKGEDAVLLDDVSVEHKTWIGYFLKIWADKYPFQAEVKGGTLNIRPKKLIVTSNYPIDHLWGDQFALLEAIQRRFYVIKIEKPLY